jgi:hypothetical protein
VTKFEAEWTKMWRPQLINQLIKDDEWRVNCLTEDRLR